MFDVQAQRFVFLAETKNNQRLLAACCGASAAAGVRVGMSVAHGTALLPPEARLVLRDHAPVEDAAALLALARWAVRFSPVSAPDYPDGLMLDVTGCQRLYGGDETLAALVAESLQSLGLEARVAVAPTIGAAWAVARFAVEGARSEEREARRGQSSRVATRRRGDSGSIASDSRDPPQRRVATRLRPVARNFAAVSMPVDAATPIAHSSASFASSLRSLRLYDPPAWRIVTEDEWPELFERLPIAALRVERRIVDELAEVGIDHVGQLLVIPRDEIAARFDADLLLRIDQATGEAMEVLHPVRHEEPPAAKIRFAGPTTQLEAIELAVQKLVETLCGRLLKREAGVRKLVLEIERLDEDLHPEWTQETLTLSRPSRSARHIWNLLRPRIERLHLGEGIEELNLTARRTAPLPHEQEHLDGSSDESAEMVSARLREAAGQLIDLLESRLGPPAVLAGEAVATHIPESAFRLRPASEGGLAGLGSRRSQKRKERKGAQRREETVSPPRPLRLCGFSDEASNSEAILTREAAKPGCAASFVLRLCGSSHHEPEPIVVDEADSIGTTTPEPISTAVPPPGDRPTVLFDRPEPAQVTLLQPEGPILGLQWHCLHRIVTAIGPERIGRRWWQFAFSRRHPSRDYYRLQDEQGLWLWVYRSRFSRRWFVHGVWG